MEYRCKNTLCNTTDETRFYKNNKTSCKNCLKQRRDITKKTKEIALDRHSESETKFSKTKVTPIPDGRKTKAPGAQGAQGAKVFDSTIKNIIVTQQKMLEHQQRQTDALFNLAEKLLEKVNSVGKADFDMRAGQTETQSSPSSRAKLVVSHTPRRHQNLVHYKDRLSFDAKT